MIACLYFLDFPVQFEIKRNPNLSGKPISIYDERFKIVYLSSEAKRRGIKEGMSLKEAESLCPQSLFIPFDRDGVEKEFKDIIDQLFSVTPFLERDEYFVFLDVKHLKREEILDLLDGRFGFELRIGVSSRKFVAKLASVVADEILFVPQGTERDFVGRFSVDYLPIPERLKERLKILGLSKIGDLQLQSPSFFKIYFGDSWESLFNLCMGLGEEKLIGMEEDLKGRVEISFERPIDSINELIKELDGPISEIEKNKAYPTRFRLIFTSLGKRSFEFEFLIREEQAKKEWIISKIRIFLERIFDEVPLTGVTLIFSDYERRMGRQLSLFDSKRKEISKVLNVIRKKYGRGVIYEGCRKTMLSKSGNGWRTSLSKF